MIAEAISEHYPADAGSGGGPSLWNFYHRMKQGDLVILSTGRFRQFVVEVAGEYMWTEDNPVLGGVELLGDYQHQRPVERMEFCNADESWAFAGGAEAPGQSIRWTCVECEREVDEDSFGSAPFREI